MDFLQKRTIIGCNLPLCEIVRICLFSAQNQYAEENVLDRHLTGIKREYNDYSYDLKSEITSHETPVPISFPILKTEAEEENSLDLHVTEIKTECMDHSYDLKTEMTFEETPVPIDFPIVKLEAAEERIDLDKVEEDFELEVTAKEDEILTESVMDVIKVEPNIDPLEKGRSNTTFIEDQRSLSQVVSVEGNSLYLHLTEIKTECMDHSYDLKSEMTFEETPVPIDFPNVKSEAEEEVCDLGKVEKEVKLEATAEEDEVLTESFEVPTSCDVIAGDEGEKRFKCIVCGKRFIDWTGLTSHALVHKRNRPFICDVCGKDCFQLSQLKRHARVHTGEKPFSCDKCGKKFSQYCSLKRHELVHTGQKPFSCDICGNKFSDSGNLKKHARIHTAEKPFRCDICGYKFSESGNLKKHARKHFGK
ncbi:uncharacterized protein [Periplaneta americana]|uniref:uncharacterized protein n=1 Tax=Periplaneta americana TaxID=6978 RepID=UPI0037E77629